MFGGSVPKNFFPAVEKGIGKACKGVLAGYPMVNLKATLVDGSYHPVDSSEIAFKTAAQLALRKAYPWRGVILSRRLPDRYGAGHEHGRYNVRPLETPRQPCWHEPDADGMQVIEAEVPWARCPAMF